MLVCGMIMFTENLGQNSYPATVKSLANKAFYYIYSYIDLHNKNNIRPFKHNQTVANKSPNLVAFAIHIGSHTLTHHRTSVRALRILICFTTIALLNVYISLLCIMQILNQWPPADKQRALTHNQHTHTHTH